MKYSWMCRIMIAVCALTTGCDTLERSAEHTGNAAYTHYTKTRQKIAGYIYEEQPVYDASYRPYEEPVFCYKVMMDTNCYNQPQPHLHQKLIAVQGVHPYQSEDFFPKSVMNHHAPTSYLHSPIHMTELDTILPPEDQRPMRVMK